MGVPIEGDAMKIQDFANVITVLLVVIVVVSDVWITKSVQAKLPLLKFPKILYISDRYFQRIQAYFC